MRRINRRRALLAVAVLAALALPSAPAVAAPATAAPAAAAPAAADGSCTVTAASLTWGFKESFRSYISGSIAKGAWEPVDGVTYATPEFTWPTGTGEWDAATGAGRVEFAGGVRFTGHDGLLDTTIARPVLEATGPGAARLYLDVTGVTMEQAMAGESAAAQTQADIPFADVDLTAATATTEGDTVTLTAAGAATTVTEEGFAAFGNYPAGTAFDPLTVTITAQCTPAETAAAEPDPEPSPTAEAVVAVTTSAEAPSVLPWVLGGSGVVVVAGAVAALLLWRRRAGAGS